jgi:hypothetical protein
LLNLRHIGDLLLNEKDTASSGRGTGQESHRCHTKIGPGSSDDDVGPR